MLHVTEQAATTIASVCAENGAGPTGGLRISGTASNGDTALDFEVVTGALDGDSVVREGDAVLFLDDVASAVLEDKTLDVHAHGDHFHFSIDEQEQPG
jgi:Fe-S cluster assembly iron-binding protein IscA